MDGAQILLEQKNIRGRKKRGRTEGEEKWNLQVIWKNHCSILQKKKKERKKRKKVHLMWSENIFGKENWVVGLASMCQRQQ